VAQTVKLGTDDGDRKADLTPAVTPSKTVVSVEGYTRTVHHNGNQYFATAEMAEIFRSKAIGTVERGETELIPLLHSQGVELLLVSPSTVFAVVTIEVGRPKVG
jgi:hypothetical protein